MKRIIAITTAVLMISGIILVSSAYAGAARRHTIEGFMLGTGVAILGAAILNGMNRDCSPDPHYTGNRHHPPAPPVYDRHPRKPGHHMGKTRHKRYARRSSGHWEIEKIWIAPVYERKFNPGHYDKSGQWISGRYEKFMVQKGYWSENKVWVHH